MCVEYFIYNNRNSNSNSNNNNHLNRNSNRTSFFSTGFSALSVPAALLCFLDVSPLSLISTWARNLVAIRFPTLSPLPPVATFPPAEPLPPLPTAVTLPLPPPLAATSFSFVSSSFNSNNFKKSFNESWVQCFNNSKSVFLNLLCFEPTFFQKNF